MNATIHVLTKTPPT